MDVKNEIRKFHLGEGTDLHRVFGAHFAESDGVSGVIFRLWAPNVFSVSVVGDFNFWNEEKNAMENSVSDSSIWETFIPGIREFDSYK